MNRKRTALLILIVLLLLALGYSFIASPRQDRITTKRGTSASEKTSRLSDTNDRMVVRTDLLEREVGDFKGIRRDLFGQLFPPPKIEKKPPPPPVVKPPPPVVKPPTPVEIIRKDLSRFTFMGYLRKQEKWTIFLKSSNDIFLVQEGDRFGRDDQFSAVEITPEQLVIEQALQGRIVIPLVEKQPLVPSSLPASTASRPTSIQTTEPSVDRPISSRPSSNNVRPLRPSPFRGRSSIPSVPSPQQAPDSQMTLPDNEVNNEQ